MANRFQPGTTQIAVTILLAATILAVALYLRPVPGRYEFETASSQLRRFDTATGEALICDRQRCLEIDRRGNRTATIRFGQQQDQLYNHLRVVSRPD